MDSYVGEILFFAGNYAPENFLMCDGSLLSISQYEALYSLLGTTYGGDGVSTFALPDLRARIPVHFGQRPGSQFNYVQGQAFGVAQSTLGVANLPSHSHLVTVDATVNQTNFLADPTGAYLTVPIDANQDVATGAYATPASPSPVQMASATLGSSGGVTSPAPIENRMPTMALSAIMCVNGLYPQRQ